MHKRCGIKTVGDLYALDVATLEQRFGRYGRRLLGACVRGIDDNPSCSKIGQSKSISAEDTFERGYSLGGGGALNTEACR